MATCSLWESADAAGSLLAVTADHGNADQMRDADGNPVTAHSLNPVPFLLRGRTVRGATLRDGVLADVAPTLCSLVGLARWPGMTGISLVEGARTPVLSSRAVSTGGRPE